MADSKRTTRYSLTLKLVMWFLAIALVPLAIVSFLIYSQSEQYLTEGVTRDLLSVAQRQSRQIVRYIRERELNVATLSRAPEIVKAMREFDRAFHYGGLNSPQYREVERKLRRYLTYYQESFGYDDLFLFSLDGDMVFSIRSARDLGTNFRTGEFKDTELAKAFDRTMTMLETYVSDFDFYPLTGEPAAFIAAPILDRGRIIGAVAMRISNQQIYEIVNDYTGLGNSGETIVASRMEDNAVFQAPTRHLPEAAFNKKLTLDGGTDVAVEQAVRGRKGKGIVTDYRGIECLATWKYTPDLRWGLVTKIDTEEAFSPIIRLRFISQSVAWATLLLVALAAVLVARSLANPIKRLTRLTKVIAGGDLSQTIDLHSNDEIGELADSFNEMTGKLQRSMENLRVTTAAKERIESELDIAKDIQMNMVPKLFPPFPERSEFAVMANMLPARQVGGDFYDFFFVDDNRLCFLIGDVSGKGIAAALFMAVTTTLLKAAAHREHDPDQIVEWVNNELTKGNEACMFVTLFLGLLDVTTGRVSFANAGHNPPVILNAESQARWLEGAGGPALGVMEGVPFASGSLTMAPGEALFLYTDGVTEAINPIEEQFGGDRLLHNLSALAKLPVGQVVEGVREAVDRHAAGADQFDDITVLMLRYQGQG